MGYAVYHVEKGKGNASAIGNHLDRVDGKEWSYQHADPSRKSLNVDYTPRKDFKGVSLDTAIKKRIEEGYKTNRAIRDNAVLYLKHIMTGSHEEMKLIASDEELFNKWIQANYDFIAKEFGEDNIVRFVLHMDEKTPHIHAVTVPITQKGGLSAKEMVGNSVELKKKQDRYAKTMSLFDLKRGVTGTGIRHETAKQYYARIESVDTEIKDLKKTVDELFDSKKINVFNIKTAKKEIQESVNQLIQKVGAVQMSRLDSQAQSQKEELKKIKYKQTQMEYSKRVKELKQEIPVLSYFESLAAKGVVGWDGPLKSKKGEDEYYFSIPGQKTGSIAVNVKKNVWYDHSSGIGGNLISAVIHFENKKAISDVITQLSTRSDLILTSAQTFVDNRRLPTSTEKDSNSFDRITAVFPYVNHPALIQYYKQRGISPEDMKRVEAHQVHWNTEDGKRYFAIGFPHRNSDGDVVGYTTRNEFIKGKLGKTDISFFSHPGWGGRRSINVFEGMFDYMAYFQMNRGDSFVGIVLNGVSNAEKAKEKIAKTLEKEGPLRIDCYLDNDQAGKDAFLSIQSRFNTAIDHSSEYEGKKDLGEVLISQVNREKQRDVMVDSKKR